MEENIPGSRERRLMVVLTYSTGFVILEKEKLIMTLASSVGFLVL
jgi:hypothetical protein